MIKVEIELDEEKIIREGIYDAVQLYKDIDAFFVQHGAVRCEPTECGVAYQGRGTSSDLGVLGGVNLVLDDCKWFVENAKKWVWTISDSSGTVVENWLEK